MGPCQNPNCHSFGKVHPNCKCYPQAMAEGGEVEQCSGVREHERDCPHHPDPNHAVSAYLASQGAAGLLKEVRNGDLEKYHSEIAKGHKRIEQHAQALFKGGEVKKQDNTKAHKKVDDWMKEGSSYEDIQQALADPQAVTENTAMPEIHPEQDSILSSAKGRVSDYLNSLKPQMNAPRLAFDSAPDQSMQSKEYNKAKHIAVDPMSVMHHISNGTLEPSQMRHLSSMYPELTDALQKKITEKITDSQLNGHKPPSKIRHGLSTLMGVPLSSQMTPQVMQAIQASFQVQQPQQQPQPQGQAKKSKGSKSALSKTDQSFLTSNQAAASRQQKQ